MITKKYLTSFIKGFEKCQDSDAAWNAKLFEKCESSSWGNTLLSRSSHLRKNYEENEKRIAELQALVEAPLSDEEFILLADAALKIYQDGYDDIRVFTLLLERCIPHFKEKKDLDYLLPLIHAYCFEYEQVQFELADKAKYTYEDILSYKDDYASIKTRYARLTIFKAYSNVISRALFHEEVGSFAKMYALYREALALWNLDEVQSLDGSDEEFAYFVARMKQSLSLYENIDSLTPEEKDIYRGIVEEELREEDPLPLTRSIYEVMLNHDGIISNEECVDRLLSYGDETYAKLLESTDSNEMQDYIDDCYNIIASFSFYLDGPREVPSKKEAMLSRIAELRRYVRNLPYDFYNAEMNNYVSVLYQKVRDHMSYEEKKDYLLEVIMFRQPITCIHSIMTRKISDLIAREVMEKLPERFIGALGTSSLEEVLAKKEDILSYVSEAALFHDVGKVSMVGIINTQNRRLSDMEFRRLKTHSSGGVDFIGNDEDFAAFFDVMKGHHKWHDGKGGYPDDFDNTSSKVKFIIDIVTIADCTDAATDILGRNYSQGKTFEVVLDEFKQGAGTRYNPEIVLLIEKSPKLIEELTLLTTEGRMEVYKEVYSKYISPAS